MGKDVVISNIDQAPLDITGDDLFAELEIVLLGVNPAFAGSPAKVQSAGFGIDASSVASINLLVEAYELLEHKDLDLIASDEGLIATLLDKSARLDVTQSQLPPNFKEAAMKLQRFSKDLDKELLPACQALYYHRTLTESKSKFYKDFEGIKKKRSDLANTSPMLRRSC